MRITKLLLFVHVLIFSLGSLEAAEIRTSGPFESASGLYYGVEITGPIDHEDFSRFLNLSRDIDRAVVSVASEGGNLLAGIAIGEVVREKRYATVVDEGRICLSICSIIWLSGGDRKYMSRRGLLGFHAAYIVDETGRPMPTARGNALIGAYVSRLGYPLAFVDLIVSAPPESMLWITSQDLKKLGVKHWVTEDIQ